MDTIIPSAVMTLAGGNALTPIVGQVVEKVVESVLSEENVQKYGDRLFDLIEDVVADSRTPIDDVLVLPVVKAARMALNIPDRPDGDNDDA